MTLYTQKNLRKQTDTITETKCHNTHNLGYGDKVHYFCDSSVTNNLLQINIKVCFIYKRKLF